MTRKVKTAKSKAPAKTTENKAKASETKTTETKAPELVTKAPESVTKAPITTAPTKTKLAETKAVKTSATETKAIDTKAPITTTDANKSKKTNKKSKSKIPAVEESVAPMQVDDSKEQDLATQTPPHNLHLNRFQNVVKCMITLHHIPDQCIKFEPTSTHVYLDTLKFSKKYLLRVPYPEEVEVDPENVEAVLESGVLRCDFPIVKDPHKPKNYDKVIQRRYKIDSMDNKTRKEFLAQEREKKAKKKNKAGKKSGAAADATEEGEQEVDNSDTTKSQKKRKLSSDDNPNPSKKRFLDTSEAALDLAKQINREQEQKAREKAENEYQKLSFSTKKKLERRERREGVLAAKKAKKAEMDKIMSAKDKRKQNKDKKKQQNDDLSKRVSFGGEE